MKRRVRENNDQEFNKLNSLIINAQEAYKISDLNLKLWNRFWRCLEMYDNGATYQEVLTTLFGTKSSAQIKTHKKNKNFNSKIQ